MGEKKNASADREQWHKLYQRELQDCVHKCKKATTEEKCRIAIIDTHVELYEALRAWISRTERIPSSQKWNIDHKSERDVIKMLESYNAIPQIELDSLEQYRQLRNKTVHEKIRPKKQEIIEYATTGLRVFLYLVVQDIASVDQEALHMLVTECLKVSPADLDVHHEWAHFFLENEQPHLGLDIFRFISAKNPHYPDIHFWLGETLESLIQYPESLIEFDKAIKENPSDDDAWWWAGEICLRLEQFKAAKHYFTKAVELNDQDPLNHFGLGYTLCCLKEMPDAQCALEKAVTLEWSNPKNREKGKAHYLLSLIYLKHATLQLQQFLDWSEGKLPSIDQVITNIIHESNATFQLPIKHGYWEIDQAIRNIIYESKRLPKGMHIYNIMFKGYRTKPDIDWIPSWSGVYCVYECTRNISEKTVTLHRLIYIGEAEDVKDRIANHEKWNEWKQYVETENELCFSVAYVESANRDRVEAALIFKHKPPVNDEYKDSFPFDRTTIFMVGETALLDTYFTVERTP